MTEINRPFTYKVKIRNGFENRCIRLLIEAYNSAVEQKSISPDWEENDITDKLDEYIDANPARCELGISTNVEHRIRDKNASRQKGFSARSARIDIRFMSFQSKIEYRYYMEAKNLKENDSQLKRRYIKTGIDSFINHKYPDFFLVGYLREGDPVKTVDGINRLLKSYKRENEILRKRQFKYHNLYYESTHPGMEVLKHIILDFTKS